jgi:hypothetical protein
VTLWCSPSGLNIRQQLSHFLITAVLPQSPAIHRFGTFQITLLFKHPANRDHPVR